MMNTATRWGIGVIASGVAHIAVGAAVIAIYAPEPTPSQPVPRAQVQLDTVDAPQQDASAQTPQGIDAAQSDTTGTALNAGAIAQSDAMPIAALGASQTALLPQAATLPTTTPAAPRLSASAPEKISLQERPQTPTSVPAALPDVATVSSATFSGTSITALSPDINATPPATVPRTNTLQAARATGATADALTPDIAATPPAALPASSAKAALAWQFSDRVVTDPKALATIQAFMAPAALENSAANAGQVRDDLSSVLTGVDCARLSATFIPETGVLEMRGHIPDPALSDTILDAMRAQVGDGLPVTANLLHLPSPQCGALSGIADVGLPQSTDQFTNARLIGDTSHARAYQYSEGQRLQFDLTAPDYDAFVYVDYFSADGTVIHLVPNQTIALEKYAAKTAVGVGHDRPGKPGLRITIGPPYGQEIAVAFAASHPLYEGLRPIQEPAEPYLDDLKAQIAAARASNPDFKGEWVYFFITTAPATQ